MEQVKRPRNQINEIDTLPERMIELALKDLKSGNRKHARSALLWLLDNGREFQDYTDLDIRQLMFQSFTGELDIKTIYKKRENRNNVRYRKKKRISRQEIERIA